MHSFKFTSILLLLFSSSPACFSQKSEPIYTFCHALDRNSDIIYISNIVNAVYRDKDDLDRLAATNQWRTQLEVTLDNDSYKSLIVNTVKYNNTTHSYANHSETCDVWRSDRDESHRKRMEIIGEWKQRHGFEVQYINDFYFSQSK